MKHDSLKKEKINMLGLFFGIGAKYDVLPNAVYKALPYFYIVYAFILITGLYGADLKGKESIFFSLCGGLILYGIYVIGRRLYENIA